MEESMENPTYIALGLILLCALALVLKRKIRLRLSDRGLSVDIDGPLDPPMTHRQIER